MNTSITYSHYSNAFKAIILFALPIVLMLSACKKEVELPEVSTIAATDIAKTSAVVGGSINSDGGGEITAKGVCWGTEEFPTTYGNKTNEGSGSSSFSSILDSLDEATTYYARAYAENEAGVKYGEQISFTTLYTPNCAPPKNSMVIQGFSMSFGSAVANSYGLSYGNYQIYASDLYMDLHIEFKRAPSTGIYTTAVANGNFDEDECVVHGVFGFGMSYNYIANKNAVLHVTKTGDEKYEVVFCDLRFSTSSPSGQDFDSEGNVTVE